MRDRLDELGDAEVVLVTFTRRRNLRGYRGRFGLPYPVLADESRATYGAYGLRRGAWWRVWGPGTILAYASLVRRGAKLRKPPEDPMQLGGDFVVGRDGRLVYVYRSKGPSDRPRVEELVAATRRA